MGYNCGIVQEYEIVYHFFDKRIGAMHIQFLRIPALICMFILVQTAPKLSGYPQMASKVLYSGSIQFPKMHKLPNVRIYWKGYRVKCECNDDSKKITFIFADDNNQPSFKLLFTESLQFETEQNVVKYLKIQDGMPYKFYSLTLAKADSLLDEYADKNGAPKAAWRIHEYRNALHNGIIPDDTIIICLNPNYVEKVEGGDSITLPTIKIRNDVLAFAGSEEKLHQHADELFLSLVMDCDAIHTAMQQEVRPKYEQKMVLTLPA